MDIAWLKDFEALVACKNFSRAAQERNVSQPAFSRRIRALENDIGVRLINRETLPLTLTPAGEVFLSQARVMLHTYEETIERCQTIDAARENIIRFATSQSLYMTHYKTQIAPIMGAEGLDIDLNSTSWAADQFVSALQQSYCDVILTYWHPSMDFLAPLEVAHFEYLTLSKDQFVAVTRTTDTGAPAFQLASSGRSDPVPLLSYGAASALRSVQNFLVDQVTPPRKLFAINQNALANSVKAMILEGFGIGWLPLSLCHDDLHHNRLSIVDERMTTELEVRLYRDPRNTKPTLAELWSRLSKMKDRPVIAPARSPG